MADVVFRNVDPEMLNAQRILLVEMLWNDEDSILWGLVNMLDSWYDETFPPLED